MRPKYKGKQKHPKESIGKLYQEFVEIPMKSWVKMTDEEKAFLWRFNANFEAGYFRKDGYDLIHEQDEKREVWRQGNSRKDDAFGVGKINGFLFGLEEIGKDGMSRFEKLPVNQYKITSNLKGKYHPAFITAENDVEDEMIEMIDRKRKHERGKR